MKRKKAFTLTELIVVVVAIAMLVIVLVQFLPRWSRQRRPPRRVLCAANLNGISKGIILYMTESDDCPPWIDSTDWSSATGTNAESITPPTKVSPTALMFLIVRSGQPADLFRCPSDKNATKMSSARFASGDYYWDFHDDTKGATAADHCKKVSYSYQAPLYDPSKSSYSSGYTAASAGGLAIVADKTPGFDGKTPCTNWSNSSLSEKQRKAGMSQNHDSGDFINVLYADGHVKGDKRADVGIGDDNIYSASDKTDAGTQGAGSTTLKHHLSDEDSFLIGPVK